MFSKAGFPWLDLIIIFIFIFSFILGIVRGLFREVTSIVSIVAGLFLAFGYWQDVSLKIIKWIKDPTYSEVISFFGILIGVILLGKLIGLVISKIFLRGPLEFLDRALGGIFGILKGFIISVALILIMVFLPLFLDSMKKSYFSPIFLDVSVKIVKYLPIDLQDKFYSNYKYLMGKDKKHGKIV
ncbi:MAG: CvpA family protein [Acidobacteriota bacterium]